MIEIITPTDLTLEAHSILVSLSPKRTFLITSNDSTQHTEISPSIFCKKFEPKLELEYTNRLDFETLFLALFPNKKRVYIEQRVLQIIDGIIDINQS